jgi:hypothetical protein
MFIPEQSAMTDNKEKTAEGVAVKKITIMGSKPDSRLPDSHVAYFVNGSVILFDGSIPVDMEVIHFVNGNSIRNFERIGRYQEIGAPVGRLISDIDRYKNTRFVLYNTEGNDSVELLIDLGVPSENIRIILRDERDDLLHRLTGYRMPLGIIDAWKELSTYEFTKLCYSGIYKRNILRGKDYSPYFRPSSGIFAVLFAIDEHGFDHSFTIAGISFQKRDKYKVSNKVIRTDMENKINLQWHILPDRKVVRRLVENAKIDLNIHD